MTISSFVQAPIESVFNATFIGNATANDREIAKASAGRALEGEGRNQLRAATLRPKMMTPADKRPKMRPSQTRCGRRQEVATASEPPRSLDCDSPWVATRPARDPCDDQTLVLAIQTSHGSFARSKLDMLVHMTSIVRFRQNK